MKPNRKAGVPIGTIAIIIIVLVAGFGIYWFMSQDDDCSDVQYRDTNNGRRWSSETTYPYEWPSVVRDDRADYAHAKWTAWYLLVSTGNVRTHSYPTLQGLEDGIDGFADIREEDRAILHRIVDCIQAGCPGCEEK